MITTSGNLKVGIEFAGTTHKTFVIRAAKVRDTIDATASAGVENSVKFMLATYALQLVSLGDIPKENITSELLADLYDVDLVVLQEAAQELEKKLMNLK